MTIHDGYVYTVMYKTRITRISILLDKDKMQYLFTCKVSSCCISALHDRVKQWKECYLFFFILRIVSIQLTMIYFC